MSQSALLAEAFAEYRALRNPKGLNALTLDRIGAGTLDADSVLSEYTARVRESIDARAAALKKLASFPAGVNIRLITPNGRTIDANGSRIVSAIIREDSDIMKGEVV